MIRFLCKAEAAYRNLREGQANKSARPPAQSPAPGERGHRGLSSRGGATGRLCSASKREEKLYKFDRPRGRMLLRGFARASVVWFLLLAASTISWGSVPNPLSPPALAPSHARVAWQAMLSRRPAHSHHLLIEDGPAHLLFHHRTVAVLPFSTTIVNLAFAPSPRTVRDLLDVTERRRE